MLGVEDEGDMHHPALQLNSALSGAAAPEMTADTLFIAVEGDADLHG